MALTIRQLARKGSEQNAMSAARLINRFYSIPCTICGRKLGLHIGQNRMPVWWCATHPEEWASYGNVVGGLKLQGVRLPKWFPKG